jgi:hypothetical protein
VLEVDERPVRPETLAEFFAGHDVTRTLEHHRKYFEGLILKPDADAPLSQFARMYVDLEGRKSLDVRQTPLERQHGNKKFTSPSACPDHFLQVRTTGKPPHINVLARHQRFSSELPPVH